MSKWRMRLRHRVRHRDEATKEAGAVVRFRQDFAALGIALDGLTDEQIVAAISAFGSRLLRPTDLPPSQRLRRALEADPPWHGPADWDANIEEWVCQGHGIPGCKQEPECIEALSMATEAGPPREGE
jgi:hypothetical protein